LGGESLGLAATSKPQRILELTNHPSEFGFLWNFIGTWGGVVVYRVSIVAVNPELSRGFQRRFVQMD